MCISALIAECPECGLDFNPFCLTRQFNLGDPWCDSCLWYYCDQDIMDNALQEA